MHPVLVNDGEVELLKQAREESDWTLLPTWKLRYLYQRLVAFPAGDLKTVKDIANLAREQNSRKVPF